MSRPFEIGSVLGLAFFLLAGLPASANDMESGEEASQPPPPQSSSEIASDEKTSPAPVEPQTWGPRPPVPKNQDWIQLNTREWLKGEITRLYNDKFDFDSDKLDDLSFDWDDVIRVVTANVYTVRFVGREIVMGTIDIRGDVVIIEFQGVRSEHKRADIVSITPGAGHELDYWTLKFSVGMTGQSGNTNQLSVNTTFDLARETALSRWTLDYNGNIATQDSDRTANNHRLASEFDYFVNRRLYAVVPGIEFFQDEFQNIKLRVTPFVGFGYQIVDRKWVEWNAWATVGYQGTRYESGGDESGTESDVAIPIGTSLNFDFPDLFELDNSYQVQIVPTDIGKTNHHFTSTLSVDVWGPIDLNTTFQLNRIEDPQPDANGDVPKQNDYLISVGFELNL